eukprot:jgi/Mesvir1/4642/Mv07805-RA.1
MLMLATTSGRSRFFGRLFSGTMVWSRIAGEAPTSAVGSKLCKVVVASQCVEQFPKGTPVRRPLAKPAGRQNSSFLNNKLQINLSSLSSHSNLTASAIGYSNGICPDNFFFNGIRHYAKGSTKGSHTPVVAAATSTVSPSSEEEARSTAAEKGPKGYGAAQIQVLEGLEPVRKRPGMYIGSTGARGLHHLVYEVLDNAVDEVQAGHATTIYVELHADGSVSVMDNGRGIPTDTHPTTGKSALETVLTVLHAGGKFGGDESGYKVSGGLHGVGVSVVNALSERLDVQVWRDGFVYDHAFKRGAPLAELKRSLWQPQPATKSADEALNSSHPAPSKAAYPTGTRVRFMPDKTIFTSGTTFDYHTIALRLRELAFLNKVVTIIFTDSRGASLKREVFHYAGGIAEYVQLVDDDKETLHAPIYFSEERSGLQVEVAMQWCQDAYSDTLLGFANSIRTTDGGTHMDGLRNAVTRVINAQARKSKLLKEGDASLSGDHVREGLTCIVSVKLPDPEFEGQTKTRLGNPEARRIVDSVVSDHLTEFLDLNPAIKDALLKKAISAFKAWEAAKKARELVRRKSVLKASSLPGKLADCSNSDPATSEIFIVEGDSAGGSAKQARSRQFQAILPLRGKIMNVERKDDAQIYKNTELQNIIMALGLGIKGEEFNMSTLRYHKIVILTDADVDGAHIRTLLLTFLYRYQRALFEQGFIYVGVPPLYKVEEGKQVHYCYDDAQLRARLDALAKKGVTAPIIQRFKGLGEMMPEQLWATTMDPAQRRLRRLTVEDAADANMMFSMLMGNKVGPRRELVEREGPRLKKDVLDI